MVDTAKVRVCSFVNTGSRRLCAWWRAQSLFLVACQKMAASIWEVRRPALYSTNIFQKELQTGSRIRPVTMMSINELEEILPHVSTNSFSWPELLNFRSNGPSGGAFSVRQAIYDLLQAKDLPATRNQAIRKNFDEVLRIIGSRYQPAAG